LVECVAPVETSWEDRHRNDLYCVKRDVKPYLTQCNAHVVPNNENICDV